MAWESNPENFSPAATKVPFDPPLPLLRGPVSAAPADDRSAGPFVLAFRDAASWRTAFRMTESKITEQCEGVIFSPIPFQADNMLPPEQAVEQEGSDTTPRSGFAAFKEILSGSFKRIFFPSDLNLAIEVISQGITWHPHKDIVAFISGSTQVTICDYEDSDGKVPFILTSEAQRNIKALEWRPNGGMTLCVACMGGVCIWSASYPGNIPSMRSGVTSSLGTVSRGSGTRWILVDFLCSPNGEQISAISFNPDGRYLASASYESSSFTIWDVTQGIGTPVRRGLGTLSILKWSPTGDYLLTTMSDGTFYIWETNSWTSEPWTSTGGYVTGAGWDPLGRMVLLAFSESNTLGSLHLASRPPALDAHLLQVELPEIASTGSCGIEKIAWDASGEHLALSYKGGGDLHSGLIAVYDIKRMPLISPSLLGYIRGPGENPKPLAFAFHSSKFKDGPLLSVCWSSGLWCTYPLFFRTHALH